MMNATLRGKPDAGNPHVRFDEGEVVSAKPRRGSLLYKRILFCFALAATATARADEFAILRCWGSYLDNKAFIDRAFAAQERHPGLLDEIWFAGCGGDPFAPPETCAAEAARLNLPAKATCGRLGIRFSYQQGVTLNHAPDGRRRAHLPEDAWAVDAKGVRRYGVLCATSPEGLEFSLRKSEAIIRALGCAAYWPDDDLRLDKSYHEAMNLCFCDRCVRLFNERTGGSWTRETLTRAVFGPPGDGKVRRDWTAFNAWALGEHAKSFRAGRDAAKPDCFLGQQIALSGHTWDGDYWKTVLTAYAGPDRQKVGIRPGALFYTDADPREVLDKAVDVAREAARAERLGFVSTICYETENWPHVGAKKNPVAQMHECALALAMGCNSLALYHGADCNAESEASWDYWFETFARFKSYLLSVRDACAGTRLGGVALFHGSRFYDLPEWGEICCWSDGRSHQDPLTRRLAENGVPVSVVEAEPDAYAVNVRAVRTLAAADLSVLFAKPVLMDVAAFRAFAKSFPDHELSQAVSCAEAQGGAMAAVDYVRPVESFSGRLAKGIKGAYAAKGDVGWRAFSSVVTRDGMAGTALVRLSSGARVVLLQDFFGEMWTGYRRAAVLDALDAALPGGMGVRLTTGGYAVAVVARKKADGTPAGAFLMNFGLGETPPLEVVFRTKDGERKVSVRPLGGFSSRFVLRDQEPHAYPDF